MAPHHERQNGHSSQRPHFFKIVFPKSLRDGKLRIPPKFARVYGNELSSPVSLKVPNGQVWKIELTKSNNGEIWLQNGWKKFAEHFSLEFGHFLVFRYEGNSQFHVIIFDRSASEIAYPCLESNEEIQLQEVKIEDSEDDDFVEIINNISSSKRQKPESQYCRPYKMMRTYPGDNSKRNLKFESVATQSGHGKKSSTREQNVNSNRRLNTLNNAEKYAALQRVRDTFKTDNPLFLVVMQPAYVGQSRNSFSLNVPKEFCDEHLMDVRGDVILRDSNGKTWTVEFQYIRASPNHKTYGKFCNGWSIFARDNNLQVGDVCAFELTDCTEISFKVSIDQNKETNGHASQDFIGVSGHSEREATHREGLEPLKACETAPARAKMARKNALQRAKTFTSENPHFCVVLQRSYVRKSPALCVPLYFSKKYITSTLSSIDVVLCAPNGKSWTAEYHQRTEGRPYGRICKGWRAFVREKKLKVGDVCILEMTETDNTKICFNVIIYKATLDDSQPAQGVAQEPLGSTSQSLKAAKEEDSVPPLFKRFVLPIYLEEKYLDIPFGFLEQYLEPNIQKLILQVADRSWPVEMTSNPRCRTAKLTGGWIKFASENHLNKGDFCVFEVDTVSSHLLKVSISKCGR